jgi:epoxyqueuosine reductase
VCYVYELLKDEYDITLYFYNPNIAPEKEYNKRLNELINYSKMLDIPLIIGTYDIKDWTDKIKEYKSLGERSRRCNECFDYRLDEVFKKGIELGADIIGTVLSISPHKDADVINEIGNKLSLEYNLEFLTANFKKKDGYKKSVELSGKFGFYRQNYCGCIYSKMESEESRESAKNRLE